MKRVWLVSFSVVALLGVNAVTAFAQNLVKSGTGAVKASSGRIKRTRQAFTAGCADKTVSTRLGNTLTPATCTQASLRFNGINNRPCVASTSSGRVSQAF